MIFEKHVSNEYYIKNLFLKITNKALSLFIRFNLKTQFLTKHKKGTYKMNKPHGPTLKLPYTLYFRCFLYKYYV